MSKYITTVSVHDDKREAEAALQKAARLLAVKGRGRTHFVKVENKRGAFQVNLYER